MCECGRKGAEPPWSREYDCLSVCWGSHSSEELLEQEAKRPERLVPISVDLDVPSSDPEQTGIKVKDRFLWNVNGETVFLPRLLSHL